jgi:hypothetical protein
MGNKRRQRRNPIVRSIRRLVLFFRKLFGLKPKRRPVYFDNRVREELTIEPVETIEPVIPPPDIWDDYEWARLGDLLPQINWQAEDLELSPHTDRIRLNLPKNIQPPQNFDLVTLGDVLASIQWQQTKTSVYTKAAIPERQGSVDPLLN